MKMIKKVTGVALAVCLLASNLTAASSGQKHSRGAVFAMTNSADNNEIAMFARTHKGELKYRGKVATGGIGSFTQPIDPLASQNSLVLTEDNRYLLATNAGSNDISVFAVFGHQLRLVNKAPSNGIHPVSITVNDDVVYVLNTGGDGTIAGFKLSDQGVLTEIPNSVRSLEIGGTIPPQVNDVNHQILFNPYGDRLVVSGGINNNLLQTFSVDANGVASEDSIDTRSEGDNPFSITFTRFGDLVVAEGEPVNALSSYDLKDNNELLPISSTIANGKAFSCWVISNGNEFVYLINTGTDDISLYETSRTGELTLLDADIVTLSAGALQTDVAFSDDGNFLYTLNGGLGSITVLGVNNDNGALNQVQEITTLSEFALQGLQGIAAY